MGSAHRLSALCRWGKSAVQERAFASAALTLSFGRLAEGSLHESYGHIHYVWLKSGRFVQKCTFRDHDTRFSRGFLREAHSVGYAECASRKKPREKRV